MKKADLARIGVIGALAGMAPDLDVLIQSPTDPLLQLEYHRQFTHSLLFIPIGALVCAVAFWPFVRHHMSFKPIWLAALAGYATRCVASKCGKPDRFEAHVVSNKWPESHCAYKSANGDEEQ